MPDVEESPEMRTETVETNELAVQDPKTGIAARLARFKALQAQKSTAKSANREAARKAESNTDNAVQLAKAQKVHDQAAFKLARLEDPDGRKQAWDYTVEESANWDKRTAKKQKNKDQNVFRNFASEGSKVYKRQVKQMGKVDLEAYQERKAAKIQDQLSRGLLVVREDEHGNTVIADPITGRENEPVEESHSIFEHKPDKEAEDRLVTDHEKREQTRLAAKRRRDQHEDGGDVTYINERNKQFNLKLARAYNKYTAETRESFERGTAL
ncbi:SYF2 splicing factor-domain-containing protein [Dendryphion nanum]|uniref:Pre-mRNA-splicing factor SYF2 n=1 Tax=Dendryphion nanum TaxID=256645 RepID=A0A9P9I8X9_9PLEO|nr:SYF2 splicing factor-domain-containing protein [Dendryphion nanum]